MARNKDFPDEARIFIVERLACFDTPSTVVAAVKERFGLDVSRQAVERYDPTKLAGQTLSAKFRAVFDRAREAFRRDIEGIPIASKAVRLKMLGDMAEELRDRGNYLGAAQLLEQAAKEMGGMYVGRAGGAEQPADDKPLEPRDPGADHLADIGARYAKGLMVVEGGKK